MDTKKCSKCHCDLSLDRFSPAGGGKYLRPECKGCSNKLSKERKTLKKKYGTPPNDYQCPICHKTANQLQGTGGNAGVWVIDHCHNTTKFRGWLCHNCNLALGKFNDDITIMKRAIKYLKHKKPWWKRISNSKNMPQ